MDSLQLKAFSDELEKIAVRIRVMHGTHQRFPILKAGVGKLNLPKDPNPRLIYVATKSRSRKGAVREFAERAVEQRGGEPVVGYTKIDTKKGWRPHALSAWGRKHIGTLEDALDIVDDLDRGVKGKARGELHRALQLGVGSWKSPDAKTTLKVKKWRTA